MSKRNVWIGAAIAIVVIALIEATSASQRIREALYSAYAYAWWDLIKESRVEVGGTGISLPPGEYGWIVHSPSSVTLISRAAPKDLTIIVDVGSKVTSPDRGIMEEKCRAQGCNKVDSEMVSVGGSTVQVTQIEYVTDDKQSRVDATFFLPSSLSLVRVFSSSDKFSQARSLSISILKQVVEKAAEKT